MRGGAARRRPAPKRSAPTRAPWPARPWLPGTLARSGRPARCRSRRRWCPCRCRRQRVRGCPCPRPPPAAWPHSRRRSCAGSRQSRWPPPRPSCSCPQSSCRPRRTCGGIGEQVRHQTTGEPPGACQAPAPAKRARPAGAAAAAAGSRAYLAWMSLACITVTPAAAAVASKPQSSAKGARAPARGPTIELAARQPKRP